MGNARKAWGLSEGLVGWVHASGAGLRGAAEAVVRPSVQHHRRAKRRDAGRASYGAANPDVEVKEPGLTGRHRPDMCGCRIVQPEG